MKVMSGTSNLPLAQEVVKHLNKSLLKADITKFPDGEIFIDIHEAVRGENIYLIQNTASPVNDSLVELLLSIHTLKQSLCKRVIVILPYFGYSRQDRRTTSRSPISAKLMAQLICTAGADNVVAIDLHSTQTSGFFNIPVDLISANRLFISHIKENYSLNANDSIIVSPDVGGVTRANTIANKVSLPLCIVHKKRPRPSEAKVINIIGDVKNKHCFIVDDIIDSAQSMLKVAIALKEAGAKSISAYATHGVFSNNAIRNIEESCIDNIMITNSIQNNLNNSSKIKTLSIARLLAKIIDRMENSKSLSNSDEYFMI